MKYSSFLFFTTAILLEIIFTVLPTSDSLEVQSVTEEDKILRYKANRDVRTQVGFNFQHVNEKHINNYGFINDKDYQKKDLQNKPVISVIGDSYVDAIQVQTKNSFHAILDEDLKSYDVYSIGVSGSPLSQYLAFSRYVAEEFDPTTYVFLIIGNDFDQSFFEYKKAPGFHYFSESGELSG